MGVLRPFFRLPTGRSRQQQHSASPPAPVFGFRDRIHLGNDRGDAIHGLDFADVNLPAQEAEFLPGLLKAGDAFAGGGRVPE